MRLSILFIFGLILISTTLNGQYFSLGNYSEVVCEADNSQTIGTFENIVVYC